MSTKLKVLLGVVGALTCIAIGRYTVPIRTVTKTQIVYQDKKTEDTTVKKDDHSKTTIVAVEKPDGTKTTTTTITDDDKTDSNSKSTDTTNETETQTKTVTAGSDKVTILALGATNLNNPTSIDYGLSVSKQVLGPITIGVFGFQSSKVGIGLGLTF